jgi:DNA-binding LacI/PurR family transcriptional regulator
VTLADVARAAEVSTATVSHALNGTGRLNDDTRRRVRALAIALGYSTPRSAPTRALGLAVTTYPTVWNYTEIAYFAQSVAAATAAAHAWGYALTTLPAGPLATTAWHSLPVDGMLILDSPSGDPVAQALRARGVPLVFDGAPVEPRPGDLWVDNDHAATTYEVLGHLRKAGARRIALQAGTGTERFAAAVTTAYEQWCSEHEVPPLVVEFDKDDPQGLRFDGLLLGAGVDAVYAAYDPGGRQLLAAARRHGLRVPDDLLLVCASEDPVYERTEPPVTTLSLSPAAAARAAVELLVALAEGSPDLPVPGSVVIPAGLNVRISSRPAPSG